MAKDYFQDITPPPSGSGSSSRSPAPTSHTEVPDDSPAPRAETLGRTIRDIQVSSTRQKLQGGSEVREIPPPPRKKRRLSGYALWGGVAVSLLVLGAIALVALRPTSVTVVPRSHTVLFDETARFTAYPADSAATGTLPFTTTVITLEDSEVVASSGVEHVEERASGTITVYNEYSASPVRLIKNTRFETPNGLVYRTPSEIMIPGKKGSTPGEVSITVFADDVGEEYNVGPIDTLRLPGLASTPDMYKTVHARSTTAMTGGFSGERPTADPAALEAAQAQIRSRLEEKVRAAARERVSETTFAFSELAQTTFESLPPTREGETGVRMHERARMELPIFPADVFAYTIGESVSAAAEIGAVSLKPLEGFSAQLVETPAGPLATSPITFSLEGRAQLVWNIDTKELSYALAGRDEVAFEAIVENFPGVAEARARIEPFWKRSFPSDPAAIKIKVEEPTVL